MTTPRPKPFPKAVQVGPYRYTVECDQAAIDRAGQEMGGNLAGHANHAALRIDLAPDLARDYEAETLLHEVLHGVFCVTGIGRDFRDAEEPIVARMAPMLLDVLRRNPDLVAYLVADAR